MTNWTTAIPTSIRVRRSKALSAFGWCTVVAVTGRHLGRVWWHDLYPGFFHLVTQFLVTR